MTHIYQQLVEDHKNLTCVLDVLEREIGRYDTETEDPETEPNMTLILDIMDYIHDYPEHFHHPLEEAAFDHLLEHNQGNPDHIARIRDEHVELEHGSDDVRQLINGINVGNPTSLDSLHESLDRFLDHQRSHIRNEEATVFKAIEALSQEDSDKITARVEARLDPLFGHDKPHQYDELLRYVASR